MKSSWFNAARFGLFIHWGPYAAIGRGEQVLFRELMDQREYAEQACRWNPRHFDAPALAALVRGAGMGYAVFTARHHDGYCLWDSRLTDYTSVQQAPKRDFVREYVEALRAAGIRVGLYYSLADFRIPAYWEGPKHDPAGWERFRDYLHGQVRELLTAYGQIDVFWFDGAWPHSSEAWRSRELVAMMRKLQPEILINNRLGKSEAVLAGAPVEAAGALTKLGDFSTPEHVIVPDPNRLWESCQVSTWRLWGYTIGEHWRPADYLLDLLVEAAGKGGNLLLNVGPDGDGRIPPEFTERAREIGAWMRLYGEAIANSEPGEVCEFITHGWQTKKGQNLYLIIRFWDGRPALTFAGLETRVKRAVLMATGKELNVRQDPDHVILEGLPAQPPGPLFPVIRLECDGPPVARPWAVDRLWTGDARRMTFWTKRRGTSVWADGVERG